MKTDLQTYTEQLLLALRLHDVPGPRIAEALAEVQSHVAETGEDPEVAFGPASTYANELVEALAGEARASGPWWRGTVAVAATFGLASYAGAWLALDAILDLAAGEPGRMGLSPVPWLLVGLLLLGGLAVGLHLMGRSSSVRVLDPRTGEDMVPPAPRWVLPTAVLAPVLLAALVAAAVSR